MQEITAYWRFWLFWVLAFLSFPIAGLLANLVGSVITPVRAILAGAIGGATLGLIQWLVLKSRLPLPPIGWVVATSVGMAVGLAIGTVMLGSETGATNSCGEVPLRACALALRSALSFSESCPCLNRSSGLGL